MKLKHMLCCGVAAATVSGSANAAIIQLIDQGGVVGSAAEQGFNIAAAYWGSVLSNNVTIRLGVAYNALPPNVIGSTGSSGQDFTAANWEARIAASRSNSLLDQTAILPTLNANGAIAAITSGPRNASGQGVNTAAANRVYDNDSSANNRVLYLNTAVVKAIGGTAIYDNDPTSPFYNPQQLDGEVQFSNSFGFDFNPTNGVSANTFDFIGVAIHEIGHALGFVSGVDVYDYYGTPSGPGRNGQFGLFNFNNTSLFSSLDMFRYSNDPTNIAPGAGPSLDLSVGVASYFSIDGGLTQLFGDSRFSTGDYNGDGNQASHWKDSASGQPQLGIMDPTFGFTQIGEVTALDLAAYDAMGWNISFDVLANPTYRRNTASIYNQFANAGAVPEPATWGMMLLGFGLVGAATRRRRGATAVAA